MQRICVYAASSLGVDPQFALSARRLGEVIARRGLELVYGGARVGLMGAVADAALAAGGRVVGVIPEVLVAKELTHPGLSELRVVASMHARKLEMMDLADGFVVLPGGAGTAEELFETFTWLQLGLHRKPIGLLDVNRYWAHLRAFLEHAVDQALLPRAHADMLMCAEDPTRLLDGFASWSPPAVPKWIDRRSS